MKEKKSLTFCSDDLFWYFCCWKILFASESCRFYFRDFMLTFLLLECGSRSAASSICTFYKFEYSS